MAELRRYSPIGKVPVALIAGVPLFDSREIIRWFEAHRDWKSDPREPNLVNAIDAALDSIIQLFYLRRDGVTIDGIDLRRYASLDPPVRARRCELRVARHAGP